MADCLVSNELDLACKFRRGGIKAVYVGNNQDVTGKTTAGPDSTIDTITMATGTQFYQLKFGKDGADFEETGQKSNGQAYVDAKVRIETPRGDQVAKNFYEALFLAESVDVILEHKSGEKYYFEDMQAEELKRLSGKVKGDFAGFQCTLDGGLDFAEQLDPALDITPLLSPAA